MLNGVKHLFRTPYRRNDGVVKLVSRLKVLITVQVLVRFFASLRMTVHIICCVCQREWWNLTIPTFTHLTNMEGIRELEN